VQDLALENLKLLLTLYLDSLLQAFFLLSTLLGVHVFLQNFNEV